MAFGWKSLAPGGRGSSGWRRCWTQSILATLSLALLASLLCCQPASVNGLLGNDEGVDIKDLDEGNVERLLKFVLTEIQKLKVENRELDDCHGLEIGSVLRGKKQTQKTITYSLTLKVQPTDLVSDECSQRNSTSNSLHPEICEAEVVEDEKGGSSGMTLLRSACLQVEELQD